MDSCFGRRYTYFGSRSAFKPLKDLVRPLLDQRMLVSPISSITADCTRQILRRSDCSVIKVLLKTPLAGRGEDIEEYSRIRKALNKILWTGGHAVGSRLRSHGVYSRLPMAKDNAIERLRQSSCILLSPAPSSIRQTWYVVPKDHSALRDFV